MVVLHTYKNKGLGMFTCVLILFLLPLMNVAEQLATAAHPSQEFCVAQQDSSSCIPAKSDGGDGSITEPTTSQFHPSGMGENQERAEPDSLLHRGTQGLDAVLEKMASSRDQMMHDLTERMSESRAKMMAGLDAMMDSMSQTNVMKGLDSLKDKLSDAKKQMMEGLDNVMDQVSHSKMMEEIDLVLESIRQSKVLMELRALPEEIRQSFILSARNRSYILAGVLVAISSAILFGGAIYYAWCHHDAWSYYIGTIEEAKALLRQAKESGLLPRSRSSSEASNSNSTSGGGGGSVAKNSTGTDTDLQQMTSPGNEDNAVDRNGDLHYKDKHDGGQNSILSNCNGDNKNNIGWNKDCKGLEKDGFMNGNTLIDGDDNDDVKYDDDDDDDVFEDHPTPSCLPKESNSVVTDGKREQVSENQNPSLCKKKDD